MTTTKPPSRVADAPLYRVSLDLYHRIGESGLLAPEDRVVLLDGLLVEKASKGPPLDRRPEGLEGPEGGDSRGLKRP